jgi:hypothetical protein
MCGNGRLIGNADAYADEARENWEDYKHIWEKHYLKGNADEPFTPEESAEVDQLVNQQRQQRP